MFGKFGMLGVRFDALVREVNEPGVSTLFRAQGFLRLAADLLRWFEKHPGLQSVKVVSVVTPEVNREHNVDIRLRHHFVISTIGADIGLSTPEATEDYVLEAIPYHTLGSGIFELKRDNAWVSQYLGLDDSQETAYLAILNEMVADLDNQFGTVQVYHDLGLSSAG